MRRWLLVVLLALAACQPSSSHTTQPTPRQTSHQVSPTVAPPAKPTPTAPVFRSVCGGFKTFYAVMSSHPPSSDTARLVELAVAVDRASGSPRLRRLADALVGYVSAPSFAHDGNLAGKPVQDLADACF